MKRTLLGLTWLPIPLLLSILYIGPWIGPFFPESERPYVYRQFVPLAVRAIRSVSDSSWVQSVAMVLLLCAVGFAIISYQLYLSFDEHHTRAVRFAVISLFFLLLISAFPKHTYDVPTAMFFALALLLVARRQLLAYMLLFPFMCVNRETSILLTILFAIYFWRKLDRRTYLALLAVQVLIFLAIRLTLTWTFADLPGSDIWIRPGRNWQMYVNDRPATILFLLAAGLLACLVESKWNRAPELARTAFLIFAPLLGALYFLSGVSFEIRVFVELVPVVALLVSAQENRNSPPPQALAESSLGPASRGA
jgi:hypothetical protein